MATAAAAANRSKSVDESLWWDSFTHLFDQLLQNTSPDRLKAHHKWVVETFSMFKPPNHNSKSALNTNQLNIGSHSFTIQPPLKDLALQLSTIAGLDEVQSYILVKQYVDRNNVDDNIQLILLHYFIERQCLLKCTRQIIMNAVYDENESGNADLTKMISDGDGVDRKLFTVVQELLFSNHLENVEVDVSMLWAEEKLIEVNLVMDILFLLYHESLCICDGKQWRSLCSLYKDVLSGVVKFQGMATSFQAKASLYRSKVQLFLILVGALDLETLLRMVHDEVPFMQGDSVFTLSDIQEMDGIVSSFSVFDTEEAAPLILAWAVFICLISSLPEKQDSSVLMDIDHVGYVRQAFKVDPLGCILQILRSDVSGESDDAMAGYRNVLRTFVSAFIASYEIAQQLDDGTFSLILEIICKIYRGEEALCVQFWDRDSFIDSPIRSLLSTLEAEFPFRMTEFVCLLSALSEGTWPAECVYNYLDKSVGISSMFDVSGYSFADNTSPIVQTSQPLHVPEIEDLYIPLRTVGRILKVIDNNIALVRWEYKQSGVLVLLLRLARQPYLNLSRDTHVILNLFCRLVSLNTAVCSALMGFDYSFSVQKARNDGLMEQSLRVDLVEIICALVRNLSHDDRSVEIMSMIITILTKMLRCSPTHVGEVVMKKNIFDVALKINNFDVHPNDSGTWMFSGGLARMLSIDCEKTEDCCSLTLSVLEFTKLLVEIGAEDDMAISLVLFCLQFVLVNHELWRYGVKHARWKVTLKALELIKVCIKSIPTSQKIARIIRDIVLCDPSIHNTLFRMMCITSETLEKLHVSRVYEFEDIEGLQRAVCSVIDVVFTLLTAFPKEALSSLPVFHQALLTSATRSIPVVTGIISLISYSFDHTIQIGAAKVLSVLFVIAENTEPHLFGIVSLISDDQQITDLKYSIYDILCEETPKDEELLVATLNLLTSAALHQPAFLLSVIAPKGNEPIDNADGINQQSLKSSVRSSKEVNIVNALLHFVKRSGDLIQKNPHILLNVLIFLKALWQGTTQYLQILELFKTSEMFWKLLSSILTVVTDGHHKKLTTKVTFCQAYRYQCCSAVLEIMACDLFLERKLSGSKSAGKRTSESKAATSDDVQKILLAWCESSFLERLVYFSASCEYESGALLNASIASNMFLVHAMGRLVTADTGSLSLSLCQKVHAILEKLRHQTAFSELLVEYSRHGYSSGQKLNALVLNDLYYHIQGELEGRKMNSAKFKELAQFLHQFKFSNTEQMYARDFQQNASEVYVFDLVWLQKDLGLEHWDHSNWKTSKAVAEKMFLYMRDANMMSFLSNSKLCVLKSLSAVLSVYGENITAINPASIGRGISDSLISSCIEGICKYVQASVESLVPSMAPSPDIFNFIEAQVVLLLCLTRLLRKRFSEKANRQLSSHVCTLVLKTSAASLRVICSIISSTAGLEAIVKLFILVLLISVEICHTSSGIQEEADKESIEGFTEVSLLCISLLPILCRCVEIADCCDLSLATMDLILNCFLTSNTWLPIIQKHLQLQLVIQKLREKESSLSIPVVLKFLLTLARVRGGVEMLQTANFFLSLGNLFIQKPSYEVQDDRGLAAAAGGYEKPQNVWGLGMAVVTAMIYSLRDSSSCVDFVDSVIPYFFCENDFTLLHHLDLPSDDHEKKRARMQKTKTSLTALREIEHSLMLICVLSKQRKPVLKAMEEVCSRLRERSIHLLAFISRGGQRIGESFNRNALLLCPSTLTEEVELNRRPSFVHCKHGWFSLLQCGNLFSSPAVSSNALVPQPSQDAHMVSPTEFSDLVAVQIYRNAYLLLTFLCLQAKEAASSAEEMRFINLARFPELPVPEILHGLQDQAIAIVSALCEINKSKQVQPEIQDICFLMLQIMEKSLFLEFCVAQSCGIRPVLGRIEDFSKEFKMLVQVAEGHTFLKAPLNSLRQIISCLYPGMFHTERFL